MKDKTKELAKAKKEEEVSTEKTETVTAKERGRNHAGKKVNHLRLVQLLNPLRKKQRSSSQFGNTFRIWGQIPPRSLISKSSVLKRGRTRNGRANGGGQGLDPT